MQKSHQEVFLHKKRPSKTVVEKTTIDSVSLIEPLKYSEINTHKVLIINDLEAKVAPKISLDFHRTFREKLLTQQLKTTDPKPKFFEKFKKQIKDWNPFRRKHRFTRKMTIGLVLLGIAVALELLIHVQTLTIIFGVAALIYIIQGMKKLF